MNINRDKRNWKARLFMNQLKERTKNEAIVKMQTKNACIAIGKACETLGAHIAEETYKDWVAQRYRFHSETKY